MVHTPMIFLLVTSGPSSFAESRLQVCLSIYLGVKNTIRCDQKPTDQKKGKNGKNKLLSARKTNKILRCNKLSQVF